ncbi:MAG: hypothetical protein AAB474_02720 [Patescibacteria group bacterium]
MKTEDKKITVFNIIAIVLAIIIIGWIIFQSRLKPASSPSKFVPELRPEEIPKPTGAPELKPEEIPKPTGAPELPPEALPF